MCEFFSGWRRKVGCVLLLMAAMLMAGWVRCQTTAEFFVVVVGKKMLFVLSVDDKLCLGVQQPPGEAPRWDWQIEPASDSRFKRHMKFAPSVDLRICGAGLVFRGDGEDRGSVDLRFPYWSIVIPLTLLSAYLLLWKPRKRTGAEHA